MFAATILASMMWMISDRQEFWTADFHSNATQMHFVHEDGKFDAKKPKTSDLKGKRVLILFHGFNNDKESVLSTYFTIKKNIDAASSSAKKPVYDEVIGYLWPGCDSRLEYFEAKENVEEIAKRTLQLISLVASEAGQVDIMAHSMGNYLFLEAMKNSKNTGLVTNYFSLGAAVDNESIQKGEVYYSSIKNCKEVYVAYSEEDGVLEYLYTLAELDKALGGSGIEDISELPSHVQLVDCSEIVDSHSAYFESPQVYQFIQKRVLGVPPFPENAKRVKLLEDSEVIVLPVTSASTESAKAS
ncbi:MAG: DUF726 domain-containing protein [Chlamydiales bacterium]|nr:DUF726 domain-containing protein [Chlamydiales bacterium]